MNPRLRADRTGFLVFALLFVTYGWFFQGSGWNQNARFDQVRSIVEAGKLSINGYVAVQLEPAANGGAVLRRTELPVPYVPGGETPPFNTLDLALYEGRLYPNKAPGTTFLGVPAYWLLYRLGQARGVDPDDAWTWIVRAYLTSLASVGLLGAATGFAFLRLSRRLYPQLPERCHAGAALALGLATPMLPYATLFFEHVPAAFFLVVALDLLVRRPARPFVAGLLAGCAVLTSYPALLAVAVLLWYAFHTSVPRARAALVLAGGVAPALALFAYHAVCFGGPFTVPNELQTDLFVSEGGHWLGILALPSPVVLLKLLFSPYRGLFLAAPVFLLAPVGIAFALRRGIRSVEVGSGAAIFVLYLLMNAAFNGWHGGYCFGPRYLVSALPFLALSFPLLLVAHRGVFVAVATMSAAILLLATAVLVQVPQEIDRPLTQAIVPLALGETVRTEVFTYEGPVSASPLEYYPGFPALAERDSFNLGELLWPRSRASLLPLIAALSMLAGLLRRSLRA